MELAPIPADESQRLTAVHQLKILDSEPEDRFDRITRTAHFLFNVPSVFIALIDENRVWFKSTYGSLFKEEQRSISICGHAICTAVSDDSLSHLFEIPDIHKDTRFSDNHFVRHVCKTRYYISYILKSSDGHNVGTLCLIDTQSRSFSAQEKNLLCKLGRMTEEELIYNNNKVLNNKILSAKYHSSLATSMNRILELSDLIYELQTRIGYELKRFEISYLEWRILNETIQKNFVSPLYLSDKFSISPSLVSRYLVKLEDKGYVTRNHMRNGDRRVVRLQCTESGISIWRKSYLVISHLDCEKLHQMLLKV